MYVRLAVVKHSCACSLQVRQVQVFLEALDLGYLVVGQNAPECTCVRLVIWQRLFNVINVRMCEDELTFLSSGIGRDHR